MLYRVAVPALPPQVREALIDHWHVAVGDEIQFGDPVCDLLVSHNYKLVRYHRANKLRLSRSGGVKSKSADIRVRILSNDRAVLRAISLSVGSEVREGDDLGVASTDASEPLGDQPSIEMRLLAEMMAQADNFDEAWED
jgi:hypothetical protein